MVFTYLTTYQYMLDVRTSAFALTPICTYCSHFPYCTLSNAVIIRTVLSQTQSLPCGSACRHGASLQRTPRHRHRYLLSKSYRLALLNVQHRPSLSHSDLSLIFLSLSVDLSLPRRFNNTLLCYFGFFIVFLPYFPSSHRVPGVRQRHQHPYLAIITCYHFYP